MDKLKVALAGLKKYHFWALSATIVVVSLVCWTVAHSDVSGRFTKRSRDLEGVSSSMVAISGDPKHQNETTIAKIQARHGVSENSPKDKNLIKKVRDAWTLLYERQQQNKLPTVSTDAVLQTKFVKEFNRLWGPLEKIEKLRPLEEEQREAYGNHVKQHFPTLFKMIDLREKVETGAPNQTTVNAVGTVDGDTIPQVLARFSQWQDRVPSTLEVMMAQEDLWVYEALLGIVRDTNNVGPDPEHYKKPESHKVAPIKRIITMLIGREAAQEWGKSEQAVVVLPAASEAPAADAGGEGQSATPAATAGHESGERGSGENKASPLAGRYVDDKGRPLDDPTQQPANNEFRMMPIDLRVVIEQTAIPKLLYCCSTSKMPINVRRLRILRDEPSAFDPSTESDSGLGAGPARGSRPLGRPSGEGGSLPGGLGGGGDLPGHLGHPDVATPSANQEEEAANPKFPPVTVEIQGTIYIYNRPNLEQDTPDAAGGAEAGAPAATGGEPAAAVPSDKPPAGGTPANGTPAAGPGPADKAAPPPDPAPKTATPAAKGG